MHLSQRFYINHIILSKYQIEILLIAVSLETYLTTILHPHRHVQDCIKIHILVHLFIK